MNEKPKMKGWKFDIIIAIIWFVEIFLIGIGVSSVIAIVIYFLFRKKFDYAKKPKITKN